MTGSQLSVRARALVAAVAVAAVTTGCGGAAGVRVVEAEGRTALIQRTDAYSLDALVGGVLAVNDKGCLGLGAPDGTFRVAIWPSSYGLNADGDLRDNAGNVLSIGDEVEMGGGEERFQQGYADLADLCLGDEVNESSVVVRLAVS